MIPDVYGTSRQAMPARVRGHVAAQAAFAATLAHPAEAEPRLTCWSRYEEFDLRHTGANGGDRLTSLICTLPGQLERYAPFRGWPLITPLST
jgi:hypothetical protein